MLRVLYSYHSRLNTSTGIGLAAWHQIAGLIKLGVAVDLFCGSCDVDIDPDVNVRETMVPLGIRIPLRLLGMKTGLIHDYIVSNYLRKNFRKYNIVHCWPSGGLRTLQVAKEKNIISFSERPSSHTRYVYEVTARENSRLGIEISEKHYAAFKHEILEREEAEFESADFLLCPSDFVVETFINKGYNRAKMKRHQYGCDLKKFTPDGRRDQEDRPFHMIYIGECNPLKGLHFALEAWVKSSACQTGKFSICGPAFVPKYKQVLQNYLDHPSVEHVGYVRDLPAFIRQSDALVMPSLAEGSSLATYEGRACGAVLLASHASGAVCEHQVNALVHEAGNIQMLKEQIELLANNSNYLKQLRGNSLETLNELSWDHASNLLYNIYREVLRMD